MNNINEPVKPKILFIMHYPPPINGGASLMGKVIRESSLINEAFDAEFINLTTSTSLEKVGKGGWEKFRLSFLIAKKVSTALWKKRYNLCYMTLTATGSGFLKDLMIVCILKLFRQKIIFHFHNKGVSKASKNPVMDLLYRFTFHNSKVILLSPRLYNDVQQYVDPLNVYYCANGIRELVANAGGQKNLDNSEQPCNILFLSNMMEEKGVYILLEACRKLNERGVRFVCDFVGDWVDISKDEFLQYLEENKLSKQVYAHGAKYNQEKHAFLQNADIFVFPTYFHNETFGLVNLEAMQARLPIISTPEGGIPDVVDNGITGFLVPQKDPDALADKIELLIKKPELRERMGNAGRHRYQAYFTQDIFESKFSTIIKSATANQN
ncbi:MAG TPA: glycosyltransferase family 4 protein [Flavitalea sp.]|nr:glycosyltransferase family 4 protein [Flavitalea sp.]